MGRLKSFLKRIFQQQSMVVYIGVVSVIAILFIAGITYQSYHAMKNLYDELSTIYERKLKTTHTADEIRKNILYIRYYVAIVSVSGKNSDESKMVFEKDKEIKTLFDRLETIYTLDDRSKKLLQPLKESLQRYLTSFEKAHTYIVMGYPISGSSKDDLIHYEQQALENLDLLVNANIQQADELIDTSKGIYQVKLIQLLILAVTACILILLVVVILIRTVRTSITEVFNILGKLTGGTGSFALTNLSENEFDNIKGALSKTFIRQEDIRELEKLNKELSQALEEVKGAQEQLVQKERLVTLGQLTGGIAHNLKTPIMAISGHGQAIQELAEEYAGSIDDPDVTPADHKQIAADILSWNQKIPPMLDYMEKVIRSVMRQSVMVSNNTEKPVFTVSELVENIQILMGFELKAHQCILTLHNQTEGDPVITGQMSALIQVFNNLITNGIQSYGGKGGEIVIGFTQEQQSLLIAISDQGAGISGDVQDKIFHQMITTKGKDGTGIGLYVSYSTIKVEFAGDMWFTSQPAKGTTFYVKIPITNLQTPQEEAP